MSDQFRLRPACVADAPAISAITNHYIRTSTAIWRDDEETLDERLAWLAVHVAPHVAIVVEDAAGTVVGWGSLSPFHARSGWRFTAENSIYLRADHCGRGLGGRILARLLDDAQAGGLHVVIAAISGDQAASLALHRRHGFTEAGRLREAGLKFGRRLDAVYLERRIIGR
jgi:L-amino acid N-acyltransferase YncA